jgi:hypothetical protein
MEHKIWYDEKNEVLIQQIIGPYSNEDALESGNLYKKELKDKPVKQILVDLTKAGKMESRETRSVTNKMLDAAEITDVAFIGANAATRMIAKVLMKLGNLKANSNFFKDQEEAINWLLKNRR